MANKDSVQTTKRRVTQILNILASSVTLSVIAWLIEPGCPSQFGQFPCSLSTAAGIPESLLSVLWLSYPNLGCGLDWVYFKRHSII